MHQRAKLGAGGLGCQQTRRCGRQRNRRNFFLLHRMQKLIHACRSAIKVRGTARHNPAEGPAPEVLRNGRRRRCQPEGFGLRVLDSARQSCNRSQRARHHIRNQETAAQITDALRKLRRKLRSAGRHVLDAETLVERRCRCMLITGEPQHQLVLRAGNGNIQQARLFGSPLSGHPLPGLVLSLAQQPAHINPALQIIGLVAINRRPVVLHSGGLFPFNRHKHHRKLQALGCMHCQNLHCIRITLHPAADEFMRFFQAPQVIQHIQRQLRLGSAAVGAFVQQLQQMRQVCQPALTMPGSQHALQRLLTGQQLHAQGCHSVPLQDDGPHGKAFLHEHKCRVVLRCQIRKLLAAKPAQRHPARRPLRCRPHQRLQQAAQFGSRGAVGNRVCAARHGRTARAPQRILKLPAKVTVVHQDCDITRPCRPRHSAGRLQV